METNTNEVTTTIVLTPEQLEVKQLNEQLESWKDRYWKMRDTNQRLVVNTTTFLREAIINDGADVEDLKTFAEENDFELTKEITVTFNVAVTYTYKAPLDFDQEYIDESLFDVTIRANLSDDLEEQDEQIDVENFEIESE